MNRDILLAILDKARWAPSGDNMQDWRFELVGDAAVRVHCTDTREHCVYDLDGHPSQISFGALLETIGIAASGHGVRADVRRDPASPLEAPVFDVAFSDDPAVRPSPLIDAIERRTVQRRKMSTKPLSDADKAAMLAAVGPDYDIVWFETFAERWRAARLMFRNARLRLLLPEAFDTHRSIIDWDKQFSEAKVPDRALGVDAMTLKLMRWAMHSWERNARMNAVLGTAAPRLQMDLVPGLACAAHYVIQARGPAQTIDDYVQAGRAVQRFWLTLTDLGLYMQPEMTPLIFTRYVQQGRGFSKVPELLTYAGQLSRETLALVGKDTHPVYMGRIGAGPAPTSRSHRRPLSELIR